ncbi:uncharacterized protein MYCFIDRAFT_59548 [Pseudocercospora fijiensis CIRAD86]|uniref:Lytic polysaccharide monooxygenase n=1 Tax=Pseudocercospora fijiensis (strain CIRAD86) TaxID=383855 RepID=M3AYZ8_PSEFD|nr:uncharacterized protein MYCFIDRAFT_59548 [Pseudocercospora fijiensis CIRAD86]EME82432.1 hypothetical protein MYCFIDRAFT_59548 [Pseudocercospora fijiensis CIRAD86]
MFTTAVFTAAACGLLASTANAHMVITSPVPYGADSLNNSPLDADGSDFPCKQRSGVYDITKMNNIAVGVPQQLAFQGGATHGGGSCQLSVTMDKQPTKSSKWKVIHSILGGCPNGASGNANGSPTYDSNPTFEWTMPKGMPNGEYTLAWTWFNKIGNREMYMNCAPITVTGGADNDDVLNTLPDMFEANIGNGCTTVESEDLVFPDPGKYVETAGSALGTSLSGTCQTAGSGGGSGASPSGYASGSGSGSTPASSPAAAPTGYHGGGAASSPAAGSSPAAAPTGGYGSGSGSGSGRGGSYSSPAAAPSVTGSPGADSGPGNGSSGGIVTVTTMATVTGSGPAPSAYSGGSPPSGSNRGSSGSGSSSNGTSGSSADSVACTTQDEIICMGENFFGVCDHGFARKQACSTGTRCSNGSIQKRSGSMRHLQHLKRRGGHHAGVL